MFYMTTAQASEMLSRIGFLSEGESLTDQSGAAPMSRFPYSERYTEQAVARALADAMRDSTFVIGVITSTGMHPDAEDMNLYYGFRRGFQDHRSLLEAPAHMFEVEDFFHFRSFLFMVAAFRWDTLIFSSEEAAPIELARDQSVRFHHPNSALAKKFEGALSQKKLGASFH